MHAKVMNLKQTTKLFRQFFYATGNKESPQGGLAGRLGRTGREAGADSKDTTGADKLIGRLFWQFGK